MSHHLAPYLNKKYILVSNDENSDLILRALGVGFLIRNLAKLVTPVIQLTEQDGEYSLSSESTFKNFVHKFRIGEVFEDVTPDGRKVTSLVTQDENRLITVETGEKTATYIREFTAEEVKVTVQVDDLVSAHVYKLKLT